MVAIVGMVAEQQPEEHGHAQQAHEGESVGQGEYAVLSPIDSPLIKGLVLADRHGASLGARSRSAATVPLAALALARKSFTDATRS